jgi:enterochelin esterase family protein
VSDVPYAELPRRGSLPVRYLHGPDSSQQDGVPRGKVTAFDLADSRVYPGSTRRVWVYVPSQHVPSEPSGLVVFQDGGLYLDPDGEVRATVVLDNLIHRREIPPTVGVFVAPGEPGRRNAEYDAFDDAYAALLVDEVIPQARAHARITDDPERSAICGGSSGGSCAFTVAWHRPDRFRSVISFLGSFAQIEGGNPYLDLIPSTLKKPLRIFLQAASRDLGWDEPEDNWYATNLRMAAALAERGYDLRLVVGDGGHSPNHGGVLLPDALRWIWAS